eukprot:scaffold50852_cov66-Phaeocystis_antarctica.AAC.2
MVTLVYTERRYGHPFLFHTVLVLYGGVAPPQQRIVQEPRVERAQTCSIEGPVAAAVRAQHAAHWKKLRDVTQ